jgi:hypothetical protein
MFLAAANCLNRRRQPFQGRLPNWPSGLESADVTDGEEFMLQAIEDHLGWFGLFSVLRCSRMVRASVADAQLAALEGPCPVEHGLRINGLPLTRRVLGRVV